MEMSWFQYSSYWMNMSAAQFSVPDEHSSSPGDEVAPESH